MAIASFAPTAPSITIAATGTSARTVLPTTGTPTIALVSNLGSSTAFVALGDNTVVAANGIPVMPHSQLALTIGTATNIAVAAPGFTISAVSVTVGN